MFFYLNQTSWTPNKPFYAIKVDGVLHPCTYQQDYDKNTTKFEAFIYGEGWKKSKKGYEIPLFEGTTPQDMQKYLDTYGKYCLFYSITGFSLNSNDCVVWKAQQEFKVALSVGFDYVFAFTKRVHALNKKIQKIVMDKYKVDVLSDKMQWVNGKDHEDKRLVSDGNLFYVRPTYSIMAYFLTKPHVDVITDDDRLWKHWVSVVGYEYVKNNENEFPVAMNERLRFLFNKEVENDYKAIMEEFPMA